MTPALESVRLGVLRSGKRVLDDVSFQVSAGEIYALLGGNGAGKSTTLLTFLGFQTPDKGEVRVEGEVVGGWAAVSAARSRIAYLPESASLYAHLDARENLAYFLSLAGMRANVSAMESALDKVGLQPEARSRPMKDYSKGMRQKVAIALALTREAPILLLDEPTSGLDPAAIDEFHDLARGLAAEGRTILMVTHDVYGACQVADRIGLLRSGRLVGQFAAAAGARIDAEIVHAAFREHAA
jgi:ABC-2 type transport system ATP-binding protein